MLAELSHTPLAIFGIMAGWSRWLELRLPDSKIRREVSEMDLAGMFHFCGTNLMDYHEADSYMIDRRLHDAGVST